MLNIFQSARVKLTLWYLLIIATISGIFSLVIYRGIVREIEQGYHRVEARFVDEKLVITPLDDIHAEIIRQNILQTKKRVQILLLYANGVILIVSGALSYYLAGQSLAPIAHAMSEQKRFVEDASHELKTPLTALKTGIEVALRNKTFTKKIAREVLEENLIAANSLQMLTEDMLRLSRYNHEPVKTSRVRLDAVIERVIKSLSPLAQKKNITIEKDLETATIMARGSDMEKLFSTIVDNAIAYTLKNGSVSIHLSLRKKQTVVRISDTGIGISKEDLPHLFDRFYRADRARSKYDHNGYGLGLPIAQQITDQYNGTIDIASTEGTGTTVTITFPRV